MKKLKYWHLCLAIWLGIASLSCAQNKATFELAEDEKLIEFTTDRFTLPNLHVTPDGKSIIFDVLGDIYQVPIEGGKAEVLLQDNNWKRAGKLSPDGKMLAYVSDETGEFQVWTIDLETRKKKVYPIKEFIHYPLYGYWGLKNELYIPSEYGLYSFNIETGIGEIIRPENEVEYSTMHTISSRMSIGSNGTNSYFYLNNEFWHYDIENDRDVKIGEPPLKNIVTRHLASPNNKNIVYYKDNDSVYTKQELVSWDVETNVGRIINVSDKLLYTTSLNYSFDFIDENTIILDKEGEVVRMDIETGEYEPIPIEVEVKKVIKKPLRREPQYIRDSIITASVLRNPITRNDLDTIYFGAFGKLYSYAKETELITEIYPKEDRFEVSPSLSPDGKYLAYTTWNDTEMGHVYAREIKTGKEYQLTKTPGRYINPAWSPDGTEIVFVADETGAKMKMPRLLGRSLTRSYYLDIHRVVISKENMTQIKNDIVFKVNPSTIMPRRFYPIPVYHPSGKSVFVTTRNHEKDLPVLIEVDVETKEVVQERLTPFHTDEVLVSPDAAHIAFVFDEQVWVDTFPHALKLEFSEFSENAPERLYYNGGIVNNILLSEAESIYEVAPSYLYWQDKHTLMWGSAEEIYTYDIRTNKTEKSAEIKVQIPRAVPEAQYALTNVRIITMNKKDEIIERGTILVKNNRIEAVGEVEKIAIPENYKVFDLEGKTIMPGLIDVHAHLHLFPYEINSQYNLEYLGSLTYGITTIYDPSANALDYREQAQLIETGKIIGPRVFSSGNIIYPYPTNASYYTLFTQHDADRAVRSFSKLGVSGPIKDYMISNSRQKALLYNAAIEKDYTITTDQYTYLPNIKSVLMGYTAIEHSIKSPIQNDIVKTLSLSGINFTPTYVATPGLGKLYDNRTNKVILRKIFGEIIFTSFYENEKEVNIIFDDILNSQTYRNLKSLVSKGITISIGGHGDPLPGIGTHWEMWFLNNFLNNYDVLKAATINGAEKLDLQNEMGSIEIEKLADMVVLNENPLDDIFNTININNVILNGKIYCLDDLIY